MYEHICSWDNLLLAYQRAAKGKRGHPNAAAFEYRLEDNLLKLQRELLEKTYTPGAYHSFYIHDPKKRLISAAPFRDRVIHHALCNLIEPVFERSFIFDSYANRVGKGTHRAIDRAQQFARRYKYVLPCDVRQFFPSIDHAILKGILDVSLRAHFAKQSPGLLGDCYFAENAPRTSSPKGNDSDMMWLVDQILASGAGVLAEEYQMVYFPGDDLFSANRPRGLPIGNLTSQFWANCHLNPLDHFIKRRLHCGGYVRYVDDFLLFANDKTTLLHWQKAIVERLSGLRLTLHEDSAQARLSQSGFPFLGFVIFPDHRRLKSRKGFAFRRRLVQMQKEYACGRIPLSKITASVQGWVNHVRFANTWNLRKSIFLSLPPL
jgi:RNA-directed DNA polymerase